MSNNLIRGVSGKNFIALSSKLTSACLFSGNRWVPKYVHNDPKCDFYIFAIHKVNFDARAMKF